MIEKFVRVLIAAALTTTITYRVAGVYNAFTALRVQQDLDKEWIIPICKNGVKSEQDKWCKEARVVTSEDPITYGIMASFFPSRVSNVTKLLRQYNPHTLENSHVILIACMSVLISSYYII